jgi:hypothetical protein
MNVEQISTYSEGTLKYLLGLVAFNLTGRTVSVQFVDTIPQKNTATGIALKDGERGIIHIKRGIGWEETYRVFCHEAAHIRDTWNACWDVNGRARFKTVPLAEASKTAQFKFHVNEYTATKTADAWLKWARSRAGTPLIQPQLDALLDWRE